MIEPRDLRRLRWYARALAGSIDDPAALGQVVAIQQELAELIRVRVQEMVAEGYSWDDVARGCGIRRQTAWQKYRSSPVMTNKELIEDEERQLYG